MRAPAPSIPDLTPQNWIDLDQLGNRDLRTFIDYPGISDGDTFLPNWRGCTAAGEVVDIADARVDVVNPGPDGMEFSILNARLRALDQGWVFYSFFAPDPGGPDPRGEESLRIFFYVGKRDLPPGQAQLGVAQFRHSHAQQIILDWITASTTPVVAPPYQAMSAGDQVTLTVELYYDDQLDDTVRISKTLTADDVGRPLVWQVNKNDLLFVEDGHVQVSYRIVYAQPTTASESPVEQLEVVRAFSGTLLPVPQIKDFSGGSLDPNAFPDGIVVRFEPWAGVQAGEVLLLHVDVGNPTPDQPARVEALRLDLSSVDSGLLEVRLEHAWLVAHNGLQASFSWQYARSAANASGEALELTLRKPLKLPPPIVEQSTGEDPVEEGVPRGYLFANRHIANDVYVRIPEDAEYGPQDNPQMHWAGHGSTGQVIIPLPTPADPRRFQVPSRAIPANMGKRLDVFYQVTPVAGQPPVRSGRFDLQVRPMTSGWPALQLLEPRYSGALRLSEVPASGALFALLSWAFMAEGQPVRIVAEGLDSGGSPISHALRDGAPLSAEEYLAGRLQAGLPKAFLQRLRLGHDFHGKVQVSFDDGAHWTDFRPISLKLEA